MARTELVATAVLLILLGWATLTFGQIAGEEVDKQCASTEELDEIKTELEDFKTRLLQTRDELDSWQNTTVNIIKHYLLDNQGGANVCNIEDSPSLQQIKDEIQQISMSQDAQHQQLTMQVMTVFQQLMSQLQQITNVTLEMDDNENNLQCESPVYSCKYLPQGSPTGYYWIQRPYTNEATLQYCDMTRRCCDSTGGWMRVADLDMTDPTQYCPPGFRLITSPKRTCGRPGPAGCVSTTFPVHGVQYSRVCGRIIAYQDKTSEAFHPYYGNRQLTIDGLYVEGVSLTHGQSPRKHIWTFATALDETRSNEWVCPCTKTDTAYTGVVPPFIGQDYFCDTGSHDQYQHIFHSDDPLWDGAGCGPTSTCCSFNNPPWFCKQLPQPTTDEIELRLCADQNIGNEDAPIEVIELYIQ